MKSILIFFAILLNVVLLMGQKENPNYDSILSEKLGGDEYGMKMYVFVVLKTGNNKTMDKTFIDSCFTGHLKNIQKLSAEKQLIVAGPFAKNNDDYRGLFILNVPTMEEAKILLDSDPAIHANLLFPELYSWYGSAALPEYLSAHDKIWRANP